MKPPPANPLPNPTDREQRLAAVVAGITDRILHGESVELAAICREYPDLEEDLRALWGTLLVTRAIGEQQRTSSSRGNATATPHQAPMLPSKFGGYILEEELGRGGMGVVYRATRKETGEVVALKMMLSGDRSSSAALQRFRAEARRVQGLDHPGIIRILDIGNLDGCAYFCMELIEGETLAGRLARGPIPSRLAAKILVQVAEAIAFAHDNGVLHRDLKPSNILLRDSDNRPFVCDFGLAREVDSAESLTRSGTILGTPAYMPPEQAAGRSGDVSPASDVYSLGAILYHMLTGRPPFVASSPVDTVLLLLEQEPMMPRALNHDVDRRLEMITMRCLQKPADLRYASANALAADLRAFLDDQPVSAERGRVAQVVASLLKETHHAGVLENWGLLWMWHSLALSLTCAVTEVFHLAGVEQRWIYFLMWTAGFGAWAVVFWFLRQRMGPVTFVERQIAHLWLGSIISVAAIFPLESYLGLPVLSLSPILALVASMVFLVKASILSGTFYAQALALFVTAFLMALIPKWSHLIFGLVSAACFFIPGLKYHRRSRRTSLARAKSGDA